MGGMKDGVKLDCKTIVSKYQKCIGVVKERPFDSCPPPLILKLQWSIKYM